MKIGYRISLVVIGILLALSATVGSSYALWLSEETQENNNYITSGCFSLEYIDTINNTNTFINLTNAYPINDNNGMNLTPYTIILRNTCDIAATYDLTLTTDKANTLDDSFLKTNLKNVTTNTTFNTQLLNTLTKTTLDNNLATEITSNNNITIDNTYLLASGKLNPFEEVKYELRIWLDIDAPNETMNKRFVATVSNISYATNLE